MGFISLAVYQVYPVLSTDSIFAFSWKVISVLQAGEAKWRTLSSCAFRTFIKSCSLAPIGLSLRTTQILAQARLTMYCVFNTVLRSE